MLSLRRDCHFGPRDTGAVARKRKTERDPARQKEKEREGTVGSVARDRGIERFGVKCE